MGEFLKHFALCLNPICPTFLHVPPQTSYPYITLEGEQMLEGLPWGPKMLMMKIKIWSRYAGVHEILTLTKAVEDFLHFYEGSTFQVSLKILESSLILLNDGQTRQHAFRLKARISGEYQ